MNPNKLLLLSLTLLATVAPALGMAPEQSLSKNEEQKVKNSSENKTVKSLLELTLSSINEKSIEKTPVHKLAEYLFKIPDQFKKIDPNIFKSYTTERSEELATFISEQTEALKEEFDKETFDLLCKFITILKPSIDIVKKLAEAGPITPELAQELFVGRSKFDPQRNPLVLNYYFDQIYPPSILAHGNDKTLLEALYKYCDSNGIPKHTSIWSDIRYTLKECAMVTSAHDLLRSCNLKKTCESNVSDYFSREKAIFHLELLDNYANGLVEGMLIFKNYPSTAQEIIKLIDERSFVISVAKKESSSIRFFDSSPKDRKKHEELCSKILGKYSEENIEKKFNLPNKNESKN